jgi:serine/threonine protein kinase
MVNAIKQSSIIKTKKKRIAKKGNLIGGKKLGEGGYGCVVKPAIPCINKKVGPNEISKIIHVRDSKEYLKELDINYKLLKADPKQKYFVLSKQECILDIHNALSRYPKDFIETKFYDKKGKDYSIIDPKSKKISKNNIKQELCKIDRTRKPRNIIMDYGGEDLIDVIYRAYSHNFNLCKKYALYIFKNILKGIKLMHENKIAHRDIKPENLIFLAVKKRHRQTGRLIEVPLVRIIDFGLAQDVSKLNRNVINDDTVSRRGTTGYKPIDIDILRYLAVYSKQYDIDEPVVKEKTVEVALTVFSDESLSTVYYITKKDLETDIDYIKDDAQLQRKKLILATNDAKTLFDRYKNELKKGLLPEKYFSDINGYIYKSDIFALGVTIQRIANKLEIIDNKVFDLIQQMTRFDPNDRPNINQCLAHPLFKSKSAQSV